MLSDYPESFWFGNCPSKGYNCLSKGHNSHVDTPLSMTRLILQFQASY